MLGWNILFPAILAAICLLILLVSFIASIFSRSQEAEVRYSSVAVGAWIGALVSAIYLIIAVIWAGVHG